jgi:hypothetical protein
VPAAETAPSFPDARDDLLEATYSKVFLRIVPFLMVLWVIAWIDRVNVGFAKLQMLHDLNFSEAVYGLGAGIFFLGYFLFEVPSNLLMMRIGAKKTIARITLGWGLTSMAMVFVKTSPRWRRPWRTSGSSPAGSSRSNRVSNGTVRDPTRRLAQARRSQLVARRSASHGVQLNDAYLVRAAAKRWRWKELLVRPPRTR